MSTIGDHFRAMTENYPSASKTTTPDLAALVAELREAAEKATPGEWSWWSSAFCNEGDDDAILCEGPDSDQAHSIFEGGFTRASEENQANARLIALANPYNILALLDAYAGQTKGVRENIPMDYLERHGADLVAALRDFAKDRWALIDRIKDRNDTIADLQYRLNSAEFGDTEQKATIAALTAEVANLKADLDTAKRALVSNSIGWGSTPADDDAEGWCRRDDTKRSVAQTALAVMGFGINWNAVAKGERDGLKLCVPLDTPMRFTNECACGYRWSRTSSRDEDPCAACDPDGYAALTTQGEG